MKICVPTENDRGMEAMAASHFGRAPYFTVIDLETDEVKVKKNPACGHHHSSCHHINILQAHHVDAVVCSGVGRRALAALEEAGVEVLLPQGSAVADIVESVRSGRASHLTADAACGGGRHEHSCGDHSHGHGGGRRRRFRGSPGSTP